MKIKYNLLKKEKNSEARLGTIETNYGTYETPMFTASRNAGYSKRFITRRVYNC